MGEYEDTLTDIQKSLGIVPGFMKALPNDVLIHDWPLFKKYSLGESKIPLFLSLNRNRKVYNICHI